MKHRILLLVFLLTAFLSFSGKADAAVLRMVPSQTDVTVGNIVNVQVAVDTSGKVINNAESVIQFPTDLLEVVSVDRTASIFSLWVENPSFSNIVGQVTFNGGVPNPGFQGSRGNIVSIVFRAKKSGTASVIFSNSAIRENDGLGTDILTGTADSKITIRSSQTQPATDSGFVITSSSHPSQNSWYNKNYVEVSWALSKNAVAVKTLLSESSSAEPRVYYDSPITNKIIQDVEDGIWYFHAQYLAEGAWSKTQRYKLQIDTANPTDLTVRSEKNGAGKVTLLMKANDSLSGIDHFTVAIGSEKPIVVQPNARVDTAGVVQYNVSEETSVDVPFTRAGEHTLTVSAFDKAGNKTETTVPIVVDSIPELSIDSYPTTRKVNESIEISGTAPYPFVSLRVSLKDSDDVVHIFKLKANSYSKFDFISQPIATEGTYTLQVDMLGDSDEVLLTSQEVAVSVKTPLLLQIGSYTIGLMKVLIPAIILLLLFSFITLYGWLKLFKLYRGVRKESREAEQVSNKAFKVLREGVDRHIAQLKKTKRKLTDEEMEFLQEFSEKLEEADKIVTKEIRDISEL